MSGKPDRPMKILVIDIGGTHVKLATTDKNRCEFPSGPKMTAAEMAERVVKLTRKWRYDAVSIGYPGVVSRGQPVREPQNLGAGWVGFDFERAFGRPVRIVNDAAMQALGDYRGGKMLFLGLGTGLGSALIVDGVVVAMELGHLPRRKDRDFEYYVGNHGRKRLGKKKWRAEVARVVRDFRNALLPDEIVLGGGNTRRLKHLEPQTRRGDDFSAFRGGLRLWEGQSGTGEIVAPAPAPTVRSSRGRKHNPGRRDE